MSITKPACFALTAIIIAFAGTARPAVAEDDVLIHRPAAFHACPDMIGAMLRKLGAQQDDVSITADTAAHYRVELDVATARLVFLCNAVNRTITITRTDAGERIAAN